jgi:hypothetical protein
MDGLRQRLAERLEVLERERNAGEERLRELDRESLAVQQILPTDRWGGSKCCASCCRTTRQPHAALMPFPALAEPNDRTYLI